MSYILNHSNGAVAFRRRATLAIFAAVVAAAVGCTSSSLTSTNPSPIKCQVTVGGNVSPIAAAGGNATISVTAQPECAWTAETRSSWISEITPASGQGNGTVQVQIGPNPEPADRQGQVEINGTAIQIVQEAAPCTFGVSPQSSKFGAEGGDSTVEVTAAGNCGWTASSRDPWLTIASGDRGSGNGTVTFRVAQNPGDLRTGSLSVAGHAIAIVQEAAGCAYSIAPQAQNVAAAGASGTVAVTATAGCGWNAVSNDAWLTIATGANGVANGTVTFTAAANTGAERTGTLTVAGETFTVTQVAAAAPPPPPPPAACSFTIAPEQVSIVAAGGTGSGITVTASDVSCPWTAASNDPWMAITAGATGTGNGTVSFSIQPNPGAERTGTLTIAGRAFTVTQAAPCPFGIAPPNQSMPPTAGPGVDIAVTAAPACGWTATTSDSWITITDGAAGTGNGIVRFSVTANTGGERTGSIRIGDQLFTVVQAAQQMVCAYTLNPPTASITSDEAPANTVGVMTTTTCGWTATTNDSWLAILSGASGTGNGIVTYSAEANTGSARSGLLTIAGLPFTVAQDAADDGLSATTNDEKNGKDEPKKGRGR
jgi:hypothetical protein